MITMHSLLPRHHACVAVAQVELEGAQREASHLGMQAEALQRSVRSMEAALVQAVHEAERCQCIQAVRMPSSPFVPSEHAPYHKESTLYQNL